ncbi:MULTISPECIES: DNA-directed RNA polymerase subunit beta' [Anaerococcus]|uniref:DNA-directed RNA polymerase subunit beta' n=1 Tax=Anaerococcus nagyae TaxID=1755241 RepID=A0A3E2TGN5_9FIRM|nr:MULTISPECIES: DNA-directed RNA polymerase subunit beta' [Anaerococcus]MDU1829388.1 DNA-directed RNA polymerase subunit beta' [Anaerococcus sp.]MDU1864905.1 DNA-directed RNA polymerase subunit beta' [Anaerococcus sp.]MDU2565908.1 DNA-directed RNA polymerase subunit beta' [Anaerococcus sp.]MDU3211996.1 DNA-directed RNA polymerase subunit beta' [Anaerococcus sp.]RGB75329.1 DNA-directed RNA polymerase subunit beta' [Anaerococcus nagyae]
MSELTQFDGMRMKIASPEKIRSWSHGEVKKPETINYRTLKPEKDGLFCEKIFGPTKDYECSCGKYKRIRYKGVVCEKCGVEVTKSKVRRERMGHIELAAPVSHIWYFKGIPSKMGLLLDMSPRILEKILYFASYVVINPGESGLSVKQEISETEYQETIENNPDDQEFRAAMGAEAVRELLSNIDLEKEYEILMKELEDSTGQKKVRISRRLEVVDAFMTSGNRPEWMILDVLPVMPPELRPMVQLEGGRFATSDLNDLYRRVINRNNRLKRLLDIGAPEIIVRNEKRMLQEAVDALIDNGRRGRAVTGASNRNMKSLSDLLKGKSGRFRQNLLGKRVDYSGRSVIVVGPDLKFNQCGLPQEMALELFKPFIMNKVVDRGMAHNLKSAKKMVEKKDPRVYDVLEEVIKDHPVLLNRAPTLHRLGIQSFEPVLVEGKAIKLHPLACNAFNADFDGDQMAIHLPLSNEAQIEARLLMMSTNNILGLKDGKPITTPSQDMVLGAYYLTTIKEGAKGEGMVFNSTNEMKKALLTGDVEYQTRVSVRVRKNSEDVGKIVESSVGRFIYNEGIPQDLGYVNRKDDPYSLEINQVADSGVLKDIVDRCFRRHGNIKTAEVLDYIKQTGYKYSTLSGLTVSMADVNIPKEKWNIIADADNEVDKYEKLYRRGLITDDERYEKVIDIWRETTDKVTEALLTDLRDDNNIKIFADSGARGSTNQIRQLGGMRGLMSQADGKTIEIPVKANFREGLSVQEYFISSHGSRKGLTDTALRTADSGYLTRRMVDISQDVIVTEDDCHTDGYVEAYEFKDGNELVENLYTRIVGRTSFEDIKDSDGELLCSKDQLIDEDTAEKIVAAGVKKVKLRSVLECKAEHGVCAKCYGRNLATGKPVNIGEAVGIIAAQSIGEPGTQLTMRTFHSGGIAGVGITSGLPRVEELFEARKPKGLAYIAENSGTVTLIQNEKKTDVEIESEDGYVQKYNIPFGSRLLVHDGDVVKKGDQLTEGSLDPHDVLAVLGKVGVQNYITKEVQKVYRIQGVEIDDRHIEVIARQMLKKVKIDESGDTEFLPGSLQERREVNAINEKLIEEGKRPAEYTQELLGITKASLATDSWLSAASFQETTRVLTDASIKGKVDDLMGLKENIIIGKLIPAGTGMKRYNDVEIDYETKELEDAQIAMNIEAIEEAENEEQMQK